MTIQRSAFSAIGLPITSAIIGSGLASFTYSLMITIKHLDQSFIEYIYMVILITIQISVFGCIVAIPFTVLLSAPLVYLFGDEFLAHRWVSVIILTAFGGLLGYSMSIFMGGGGRVFAVTLSLFGSIIAGLHVPLSRWFTKESAAPWAA